MEENDQKKSQKQCIIADQLCAELDHTILEFVCGQKIKKYSKINNNNKNLIVLGFDRKQSLSRTDEWKPALTLNPCDIHYDRPCMNYIFGLQCWKEEEKQEFRIDDDIKRIRTITPSGYPSVDLFFDGINDNNFIIIAGNHDDLYSFGSPNSKPHKSFFYLLKRFSLHTAKAVYEQGIFDGQSQGRCIEQLINDDKENFKKSYKYQESCENKTLITLALCKNIDRYALVDDQNVTFYGMPKDYNDNDKPHCLGTSNFPDHTFKKISFITPSFLLAISQEGVLSFLELKDKSIIPHKQTFKKDNAKLMLKDFAVDSTNPHHVVLQTTENEILFWDLHNCYIRLKPLVSLLENETPDSLWFYNDKICLGTHEHDERLRVVETKMGNSILHTVASGNRYTLHTKNYKLHFVDTTIDPKPFQH